MLKNKFSIVFDCDGVILNSNKIKTQAFYDVAKVYGCDAADALRDYHVRNGGISRYAKFEYFLKEILCKPLDKGELNVLLAQFASKVKRALLACEITLGLEEFRSQTKHANWLIVSGGDQVELREVFIERGLDKFFDGGIFGSPDTKDMILEREIQRGNVAKKGLFLGDSKYDYQAAKKAGLEFLFLTQWTEVCDWKTWVVDNSISSELSIEALVSL